MLSTKIASFFEILRRESRFLTSSAIICYTLCISAKREMLKTDCARCACCSLLAVIDRGDNNGRFAFHIKYSSVQWQ